jgi:capsular exopolysaccharide synthesis family protein
MTFVQYLRILRRQWFVVLFLALLATCGAAAYTERQAPVFESSTQLFVSAGGTQTDINELQTGSTFTQQRVKSYADVVTSPSVAEAVITSLGLTYTPQELASRITVTNPLDTVLLDISVRDGDPARAAAIANGVAREFPKFVALLETPAGRVASPVKVSVTQEAAVPAAPVSPKLPLNLALGLLVGLGLGVAAGVLRDQLNTTVAGPGDLEAMSGGVPLGVVPFDSDTKSSPLVTADRFSGRAEAFRTLRTNLQYADVDNPPRLIVLTSALPSEGKTTTACNLALTLAFSGARVILVDGDLRKPTVGTLLGIDSGAGLTDVLAGQHALEDVVVGFQRGTLAVLPSGPMPPNPSELLGSQHMAALLESLAEDYDIVVIDAPPLLPVTDAAVLSALADGALLVVRHGKTRRDEADRALQALAAVNAKLLGTVLNFAPKPRRRNGSGGYGYGGYGGRPEAGARVTTPEPATRTGVRQRAVSPGGDLTPTVPPQAAGPDPARAAGTADGHLARMLGTPPAGAAGTAGSASLAERTDAAAVARFDEDVPWSQVAPDPRTATRGGLRRRVISRSRG